MNMLHVYPNVAMMCSESISSPGRLIVQWVPFVISLSRLASCATVKKSGQVFVPLFSYSDFDKVKQSLRVEGATRIVGNMDCAYCNFARNDSCASEQSPQSCFSPL